MLKVSGDLLDLADQGEFDVIVHGCNCFHKMGSGIAKQIAKRYPAAEKADFETVRGNRKKLGHYSSAEVKPKGSPESEGFTIVNGYTQFMWSGNYDVFEYEAFERLLNRLCPVLLEVHDKKQRVAKVGFPKIGCGLAGGDEVRILRMLERFAEDVRPWCEVTLVELP